MPFPKGSLVLLPWAGSPYPLIITPAGLRKFFQNVSADHALTLMKGRNQAVTHEGDHILPLSLVMTAGLFHGEDFIAFTRDGTIVTGPINWGHA